ncbi:hypothetical protein EDD16DRAFT_1603729 [Pisolithus croceorrhizus]|nr:hypothetical protein EDD16DRAFT_1603729 [Pisolithus croceorrhizus]
MAYVRFPLAAVFFGGLRNVFLISTAPRGSSFCLGSTGVCQPEQMNLATHNLFDPLRDTVMSCVWYSSVTLRRPRTSSEACG